MKLSDSIKRFRKARHLTQKQVAAKLGIDYQGYQRYEYGTVIPKIDMMIRLADAYNVSIDYLVGRTDNPEINY